MSVSSLVILAASVLRYRAEKRDAQTNGAKNPTPQHLSAWVIITLFGLYYSTYY